MYFFFPLQSARNRAIIDTSVLTEVPSLGQMEARGMGEEMSRCRCGESHSDGTYGLDTHTISIGGMRDFFSKTVENALPEGIQRFRLA